MMSDNSIVSLGIVDCSVYTRRIAFNNIYHKKRMEILAHTPVEFNNMETPAETSIIPAIQNQFIQKKTFLTRLQFAELPLQRIQTPHLLDRTLEIQSSIKNLISDKLKYTEEVSQL